MKVKSTLVFLMSISGFVFAQTGPGGVGSNDGTSSLVLWLDANTVAGTSGTVLSSWQDESGYGHDFTAGTGAVYNAGVVNGYPAFNFNGSSHYFQRGYTAALTPSSFTIFSATNVNSTGTHKAVISNRDDPAGAPTAGYILYSVPTSNNWSFWTGRAAGAWQQTSGGTSTSGTWSGQELSYQAGTNGKALRIDGDLDGLSTHSMTVNPSRPIRVGAGRNESTPNYYYSGDIGEVIIFDEVINDAQKILVDNYLAAKYSYTLDANDLYNEDNPGAGNYDHDVAGIGRVDAANQHTNSRGTGTVQITNPTGLGDNEFLIWGHDNGVYEAIEFADIPGSVAARLDRVWRASEVNSAGGAVDVGSVDMSWDLNGLGMIVASDLRLLVDTDNDGLFSDETGIAGATDAGGGIYTFAGVSDLVDNRRFTLATINIWTTPLPVELVYFEANLTPDQEVALNWKTKSESENAFFRIEKSRSGNDWTHLTTVDGMGSTVLSQQYTCFDQMPYSGVNYYKLIQTDFDGKATEVGVRSVYIASGNVGFLYPNPAKDFIVMQGGAGYTDKILVYDLAGKLVNELIQTELSGDDVVLELSKLSNGVYVLQANDHIERFIVQH